MYKDVISIRDLEIYAYHGVLEEEKWRGQYFYVSCDLFCDISRAGLTDDLGATVNYAEVCEYIVSFMTDNTFDLIESCAEQLARGILRNYRELAGVKLTVRKPYAPIPHKFGDVSVTVERKRQQVFIALGSNMGDRKAYLDSAVEALKNNEDTELLKVSPFIETKPYGGVEQDDFLNGVVEIETILSPDELLGLCHEIESAADRKREIHWGPRTLDVDILFYGDEIIGTDVLAVPHPDMANRDFVLGPLAEIAPYKRCPATGKTVAQMLAALK